MPARGRRSRRIPLDVAALTGREDLFRLGGAARRDLAVEAWFAGEPAELRSLAREWFEQIRSCGEDVRELIHDGCPVACVADAAFAYVNAFRAHVNVGFFHGASLADPAGLLQGSGKRMRHVKVFTDPKPNAAAIRKLIDAAYADIKARLAARA